MSSDRARVTYDPSRHYQGVVAQQGRVSLEADWNEAQQISREQTEVRTLDLVGPVGSPDDGYRVGPVVDDDGDTEDLRVHRGTLYVGGLRVSLGGDMLYSSQPDWHDHVGHPLWREASIPDEGHELVCLLLREQEVSAVEDPALRDVALGGPDTSQRLRVLQHVIRHPTTAGIWEDAWGQLIAGHWNPRGFRLQHSSRRLEPAARLQVLGHPAGGEEQPVGQGTYLGPDNQLIRVQIARVDDDGVPFVVWGYDNASVLYRLTSSVASAGTTTLTLSTPPVDAFHQPARGQAVEVLRSAAALTGHDFIAAATGEVATVTKAYDPDTREIVIGEELKDGYVRSAGDGPPPLYLRVWHREFKCVPGEEHELAHTGLRIRLTAPDETHPGRFHAGAYWMIAVRPEVGPGSPGSVYPERILDAPQPPDGPRLWLTPLAFLRWDHGTPAAEDCTPRFDGLVRQEHSGGSCTVRICPRDVGGGWALQDTIDTHASRDHPVVICLDPGTYTLRRPLRIGPRHGRLMLRAARPRVVLCGEPEGSPRFVRGLIIAEDTDGLSLEGLEIHPAPAPFVLRPDTYLHLPERARELLAAHRRRRIAIGLHATRSANLTLDGCQFILPLPASAAHDHVTSPDAEDLFATGIAGFEELRGLRVQNCTFAVHGVYEHAHRDPETGETAGSQHVALGFAQVPSAIAEPHTGQEDAGEDAAHRDAAQENAAHQDAARRDAAQENAAHGDAGQEHAAPRRRPHGSGTLPLLDDAVFDGNLFERLTAPVVAVSQLGALRFERNTVRECHAGPWLAIQDASHVLTLLDRLVNQVDHAYRELVSAHLTALTEPFLFHTTVIARTLPSELPEDLDALADPRRLEAPSDTDEQHASQLLRLLSTADAESEMPAGPAQRESWRRRFEEMFGRVRGTRRHAELVAVPPETELRCCLNISGNTISSGAAPALVIVDTPPDRDASLTIADNQLRNFLRPGATACLYLLPTCAAAANIIVNAASEHESAASLIARPRHRRGRHQTAITGNVLVGRAHLPRRPDDLPSWHDLNSVTQ